MYYILNAYNKVIIFTSLIERILFFYSTPIIYILFNMIIIINFIKLNFTIINLLVTRSYNLDICNFEQIKYSKYYWFSDCSTDHS